ncbi:NADP-dependent D-sorbitol-6-phosphate dehydrogenase [Acorus calamus]|uniref:NADP-dependent D-sorbitol-6-phosphate dehydrogenase n=1 Tax=Acorus calamus TaxID=4465 RepID=A0AAV9D5N8_ACOCL|nr:NADP-dependent D-sorbitol-6-phosphate dehydrogenase [Acorus calamus]
MAIELNSGYKMPVIGLGVWRMEGKSIRDLLLTAINIGYRHFDCAADYKNEAEVGEALAEVIQTGLVKRDDLFITTKASQFIPNARQSTYCSQLWNSDHGHVLEACKDSLKKLKLDYLDLYLVHFPVATRHTGVGTTDSALDENGVLDIDTTISLETTWHAMEDLVSAGLVRSIGISNYDIFLTRDCLAYSKIKPAVNQIENIPTSNELAKKYKKTEAQIILRWGIQRNTVVIPKSSKAERLNENFQVFDFQILEEDMNKIKGIDRKLRTNQPAKFWGIDLYA